VEQLVIRVEALLGALDQAVVATDLDGRVVFWNPAAEDLYGWPRDEAVGRQVDEIVVAEGAGAEAEQIMERLRSGQRWSGQFPVRRRDGTVFLASVTNSPVFGDNGDVVGIVGMSSDIHEKRWAEALRRGDRGSLRLALAGARVGTWLWDRTSDAVEWDATMESLFGMAEGGFKGRLADWFDLVHSEDRSRLSTAFERAVDGADEFQAEHRVAWADGPVRWLQTRGRITRDEDGRVNGSVGVAVDITDRKAAERALRNEHQIVETLHHIGASLAAELDLQRVVQAVTDAATELTGARIGAFFYNVVDADGESYVLYALSGVERSAFEDFPMPRNTAIFGPTFAGEGVVRLDDVTADGRYGHNPPYQGMPPGHVPVRSYLAAPVTSRSGEVLGGLFFGHEDVAQFDEVDERLVTGIAAHAAVAIDNARLYQAAQEQREAAERAAERLARLHALSLKLAQARSVEDVADAVVAEACAALNASAAMLCAMGDDGSALEVISAVGVSEGNRAAFRVMPLDAPLPVIDAFKNRTTLLMRSLEERNAAYPSLADVATVGRAFAVLPVDVEGAPFGSLGLAFPSEREFKEDDRSLMEAIALQGGQALGRARLADGERRAARTLQQSLLPPGQLTVPGLDAATRYHAFGDATEVGGDFYDAFPAPDGAYGVVMGDVRGKGIQSAAITALARYTVRAATQCDRRPSDALRLVNRAIYEQDDPERFCTIVHLLLRPVDDGFDIELACAGHPLPLLLTAGGDVRSIGKPGMVVGLFEDPDLHDVREHLHPGDALVLYTDGLLEARSPDGQFDPDLLAGALLSAAGGSAEDVAAAVERAVLRFEGGQPRDDMALMVLRVPS
jgi:PAS domain S-box-containing protein